MRASPSLALALWDHLSGALALYGRGDWGPCFAQLQGLYASIASVRSNLYE